jgi:hypothetical protein
MSASRAGRNAEPDSSVFLTAISRVDDLAALDQKRVHRLVDAIDLAPQIGKRGFVLARRFRHGSSRQSASIDRCR